MRLTPEIEAKIAGLGLPLELKTLVLKIVREAWPETTFTDYDDLTDGVMNAYDQGFGDGKTHKMNELYTLIKNLVN